MDDMLNTQFARVEKALTTLVDSIAAYNPAPQAAIDLFTADDELSEGLDQLAKHQANHVRIQLLRAEAEALEEQLKNSVKKLAELRHDLFNTPVTTFSQDSRAVPFDELLQYATNISRYTVPPTYRDPVPVPDKDKEEEDIASTGLPTNGLNTPAIVPETTEPTNDGVQAQKEGEDADATAPEVTAEEEEWLKKLKASNLPWYPWPNNDRIRAGNLYSLQYWREKGKDLDTFNIPAYMEEERLKALGQNLESEPSPAKQPEENRDRGAPRPAIKLGVFTGLDDMED
ncbi:Med4 domain containing protein [Pyrenophora teres f. maculata]|nr:Med4 domain containing protein [Pyrenophora teres f. maculata]